MSRLPTLEDLATVTGGETAAPATQPTPQRPEQWYMDQLAAAAQKIKPKPPLGPILSPLLW